MNLNRRFVPDFARIALPWTKLLTENGFSDWKSGCHNAFYQLRDCLLRELVLKHHDSSQPTRIETDSSGYAVGAVLNEEHSDGWHPVAYLSNTMISSPRNYPIQVKEQLSLIDALNK